MNPIVEQLAKQAGMVRYSTGIGITENTIWGDRNIERFAELIVKRCAQTARKCAPTLEYGCERMVNPLTYTSNQILIDFDMENEYGTNS